MIPAGYITCPLRCGGLVPTCPRCAGAGMVPRPRLIAMFIRGVPAETKAGFKAECARRGVTMHDALVQFMENVATGKAPPLKPHEVHRAT